MTYSGGWNPTGWSRISFILQFVGTGRRARPRAVWDPGGHVMRGRQQPSRWWGTDRYWLGYVDRDCSHHHDEGPGIQTVQETQDSRSNKGYNEKKAGQGQTDTFAARRSGARVFWWESIHPSLINIPRFQSAASLTVWGAVSRREKLSLVFIEKNVKINTTYYNPANKFVHITEIQCNNVNAYSEIEDYLKCIDSLYVHKSGGHISIFQKNQCGKYNFRRVRLVLSMISCIMMFCILYDFV